MQAVHRRGLRESTVGLLEGIYISGRQIELSGAGKKEEKIGACGENPGRNMTPQVGRGKSPWRNGSGSGT